MRRKYLSRRRVLWLVTSALAALKTTAASTAAFASLRVFEADAAERNDALRDMVAELAPDVRIGQAYLAQFPDEASLETLHVKLFGPSPSGRPDDILAKIALAETIDFEGARLVTIHGWLFSRTAARIAALAALSTSGRLV